LLLPSPRGGVADTLARLIGKGLSDRLHQTVVVENRGVAGGNIAAEVVAHANPDGSRRLFQVRSVEMGRDGEKVRLVSKLM
jgi:tripartite-type tricarboxylate transporter receptor subunit TctC